MLAHAVAQFQICDARPLATEFPLESGDVARRRLGVVSVVPRGRALFWQGEQQGQNIEVLQGVVRAVRLLENGKRQVFAFYWPGDIVRGRALSQLYTAEAVTPCRIVKYNPGKDECTRTDPCGTHQMLEEMLSLLLMISQKNSISRIASLLLRIRRQLPNDPKRLNCLQLLLPRTDMADHVGTSLETVCRTLAEFKARKLIDLPTRKTIRFLDLDGLSRVANA
jgi:CRP-like cAMP-binding protein